METKIVNLFGGAGIGKSTLAAGLFYLMKKAGHSCELVQEFAKELTWAERHNDLQCQLYVSGRQYHRIHSLVGKVENIIVDSPFLLGTVYTPDFYPEEFKTMLIKLWKQYNNVNFLINRNKPFNPIGRNQTEEESRKIDVEIKNILDNNQIEYKVVEDIPDLRIHLGV